MGKLSIGTGARYHFGVFMHLVICVVFNAVHTVPTRASKPVAEVLSKTPKVNYSSLRYESGP